MINNSSLKKWSRVLSKGLDNQFRNAIIQGMGCSQFEASGILDTVHKVYKNYFDSSSGLRSGQIRIEVLSIEASINESLSSSTQVTVTLTFSDEEADMLIRKSGGVASLRRHKIERICREAYEQGGLLTLEDLAYRILNCGVRTISRDLRYFKDRDIFIPLRSLVKDIGRSLSHRLLIIKLWCKGKEYSDISRLSHHSLESVHNYIDKFKRVVMLKKEGYNVDEISFLLKLSPSLVEEYVRLYRDLDFVEERSIELNELLKKSYVRQNY